MFDALVYTCLSPIHVTSHIHNPIWAPLFSSLSIIRPLSFGTILSVLLLLPTHCPTPPFRWPAPHPTHHAAFPVHPPYPLFSPFIFSSLFSPRAFSTSSECHTLWIIYLCNSVGGFLLRFLTVYCTKTEKQCFLKGSCFSFKCAGKHLRSCRPLGVPAWITITPS